MAIELNTSVKSAKISRAARPKLSKKAGAKPPLAISITHSALEGGPYDAARRREMIAEAAYHRAEHRGFAPGHEVEDWLAAEQEINERLCGESHPF